MVEESKVAATSTCITPALAVTRVVTATWPE
jgi:hypothetical protein